MSKHHGERIAALEARPVPDLSSLTERLDDVRNHINEVARAVAANPAVDALAANVDQRFKAFVGPLSDRITALAAQIAKIEERVKVDHLNLDNLHERVMSLEREYQERPADVVSQERAR